MSYVAQFANIIVGNIQGTGNANFSANISTPYYFGNGYFLTGIGNGGGGGGGGGNTNYSNANVASYLPIYGGVVNAAAIVSTIYVGNVTTTSNISGSYLFGNGAFLTGVAGTGNYANSNVANYLPTYTGNLASLQGNVITTANVTGSYIFGNGYFLTGIGGGGGNGNGAGSLQQVLGIGNAATIGITLTNNSGLTAAGNVQANYFLGNITQATGYYVYGNANVANYLPTYTGNLVSLTGPVVTTANLTAANILTSNVYSGNILNSGSITTIKDLTVNGNIVAVGTITTLQNLYSVDLISTTANIANMTANGTITSNVVIANNVTVSANTATGNLLTNNLLYANGKVWNVGLLVGVVYYSGTTTTSASIATNTDINAQIPASAVPKNGDIFFDLSTRVNNTQPVYIYVGGNWRQFLTAWGGV